MQQLIDFYMFTCLLQALFLFPIDQRKMKIKNLITVSCLPHNIKACNDLSPLLSLSLSPEDDKEGRELEGVSNLKPQLAAHKYV